MGSVFNRYSFGVASGLIHATLVVSRSLPAVETYGPTIPSSVGTYGVWS
jgi:hypothetical protein